MTQTFFIEELDDTTRSYLRTARDRKGQGVPGVFVPASNYLPIAAFICGIAVLIGTAWWTLPPLDDPLKTAMLQTAGLLLGGWLMLYAIRIWIAGAGQNYLGHFFLADALHLWQARGASVKSTGLDALQNVKGTDNFNEGAYQNTTVTLSFPNGAYNVNVKDPDHRLEGFLQALVAIRSGQQQPVSMPPEALGFLAKQMGGLELEPVGEPEAVVIPAEPQRQHRASSGILAYLVIVAVAVAGVVVLRPVNVRLRDDAIFELVKNREAPDLRAYLVDPRNVRHRQEVEKRLAQMYQAPLQRLRQQVKDKEVGEEFIALVSGLQTAVQPFVSLRVKEKSAPAAGGGPLSAAQMQMREKSIHQEVTQGLTRAVGDKLIGIVEVVPEVPALIDVEYRFLPEPKQPRRYRLDWTVSVRRNPDVKEAKTRKWVVEQAIAEENMNSVPRAEVAKTLQALTGDTPQVNPILPGQFPKLPLK